MAHLVGGEAARRCRLCLRALQRVAGVRRRDLHADEKPEESCRFTCLLTNQPGEELARLEQRHRARAHVEDWIRAAKEMGLRTLPLDSFARNALWLQLVL
ncbi:MAG: IS1380 family transposase, partial [Chloroflexi bacterium]|nr:IS1380 family transposase [Chloroflexota bacterium]